VCTKWARDVLQQTSPVASPLGRRPMRAGLSSGDHAIKLSTVFTERTVHERSFRISPFDYEPPQNRARSLALVFYDASIRSVWRRVYNIVATMQFCNSARAILFELP
jgi:hypothetical protein